MCLSQRPLKTGKRDPISVLDYRTADRSELTPTENRILSGIKPEVGDNTSLKHILAARRNDQNGKKSFGCLSRRRMTFWSSSLRILLSKQSRMLLNVDCTLVRLYRERKMRKSDGVVR